MKLNLILTSLLLTGCVTQTREAIDTSVRQKESRAEVLLKKTDSDFLKADRERAQEVNLPYLAGMSVPLERNVSLPRPLQKGVNTAVLFPKNRISLATAAERIMLATNLVVAISPDVYLDDSLLLPKSLQQSSGVKNGQSAPQVINPNQISSQVPNLPPLNAMTMGKEISNSSNSKEVDTPYSFDFPRTEAPLSQILDIIGVRLGIRWKYEESNGTIRFYRLVTKSWVTPFNNSTSRFSTDFEGATANSNNPNAVALKPGISPVGSTSKDLNELVSLAKSAEAVMTKAGSIVVNPSSGTITITDTADAIEAADTLVRNEINILSRVVQFKVETIQVTLNNDEQAGVDVSAMVSAVLNNMPNLSLSTNAPGSLVSSSSGNIDMKVLSGQGNGSGAVIKALNQIGRAQTTTNVPLVVRNHKAVYYNVTDTFSYVSATTPGTATMTGGGGTPGITTSQDQVGFKLMLQPNITNKDTVMLTMALDQSALQRLDSFTSGSGTNQQTVQLPKKSAEGSTSEVAIKHGQTIVLTGFDKIVDQYDRRTLGKDVPLLLGGSQNAKRDRVITVVLISVVIKDMDGTSL